MSSSSVSTPSNLESSNLPLSTFFPQFDFSICGASHDSSTTDISSSESRSSTIPNDEATSNHLVTTAFFQDPSGRTKLLAEAHCTINDANSESGAAQDLKQALNHLYNITKVQLKTDKELNSDSAPSNSDDRTEAKNEEVADGTALKYSLLFECKCQQENVIVEVVNLVGTTKKSSTEVTFLLDITARAAHVNNEPSADINEEDGVFFSQEIPSVKATLDITAVLLSEESEIGSDETSVLESASSQHDPFLSSVNLGLLALELGGGISPPPGLPYSLTNDAFSSSEKKMGSFPHGTEVNSGLPEHREAFHYGVHMTYAKKSSWYINLVQPLLVNCCSIGGARAALGATLVSLSISHSNVHNHPVLVTNISMHPGNSSLYVWNEKPSSPSNRQSGSGANSRGAGTFGRSMRGGSTDIIDMTRHVRWTYAFGTAPSLPLKLLPYETFNTVLQIDAGEDLRSRTFVSPVAVTAVVDRQTSETRSLLVAKNDSEGQSQRTTGVCASAENESKTKLESESVLLDGRPNVIATDVIWTTERVATVPADALRVDMSLRESRYKVGAPLVVSLRVLNLSNEDRNLMLLMAKEESNSGSSNIFVGGRYGVNTSQKASKMKSQSVNTAVVSEVNGYTFGVWGLSGEDDGTTRQNRDHELLAVDAALLLGDVKGQHSVEAQLRFVPLREGTLDVPNLKLYDKSHGKWYNCVHSLKIVASQL